MGMFCAVDVLCAATLMSHYTCEMLLFGPLELHAAMQEDATQR